MEDIPSGNIKELKMYYKNKQISIEVTNRCAAKCVMCPREKMIQPLETMSQEVYEKIATDAVKNE